MVGAEQVGDSAFAGLRVDADDLLVRTPDVRRVDGQVGHGPGSLPGAHAGFLGLPRVVGHALGDGVLVGARERRVHEFAAVGVPGVDREPVAVLHHVADGVDVGEVDHRIDPLRVQVEGQGDQVDVPGALAVAEQTALDPLGARQHGEFGTGDAGAAVVVRVHREDDGVAPCQMAVHVLDLVGVDVGGGDLHRGRQVVDHRPVRARLPQLGEPVADVQDEVGLGQVEDLRGELEPDVRARPFPRTPHQVGGGLPDHRVDLGARAPQDDVTPRGRGGGVEVHDGAGEAFDGVDGPVDQVLPRRGEHGDRDVVGHRAALGEVAYEVEVGPAGGRVTDLDLLEAHGDEEIEEAALARGVHGLGQRLVAVPQIDGDPERGPLEPVRGPGAVRQGQRHPVLGGAVAVVGHRARALEVPGRCVRWDITGRSAQGGERRGPEGLGGGHRGRTSFGRPWSDRHSPTPAAGGRSVVCQAPQRRTRRRSSFSGMPGTVAPNQLLRQPEV